MASEPLEIEGTQSVLNAIGQLIILPVIELRQRSNGKLATWNTKISGLDLPVQQRSQAAMSIRCLPLRG